MAKKQRLTFPSQYKSRSSYLKSKINHFYIALAALSNVNKGSAYLPKKVRDDLWSARKLAYEAACNLITYKSKQDNL